LDQVTSVNEMEDSGGRRDLPAVATAMEIALVFTGILIYIWRWQHTSPRVWMALWAVILVSHVLHHDTVSGLGLGQTGFRDSAKWVLPLGVLLYAPMLFYGFAHHRLAWLQPTVRLFAPLLGYGSWCAFQQYLTQSYFNNRLMLVIRNRHLSSALVAIMFSATHIPNLILMVATLVAGFVFAEIFASYRNIWPLALVQAVGGLLLAAVSPDALIHHMRVGPGYFFYRIR
jgi:hypothetical protein